MNQLILFHLIIGILHSAIGIMLRICSFRHRINQPIKAIVDDVNIISRGDLEHRKISPTHVRVCQFWKIVSTLMVESLKDSINK